jgi:signal peptidase I
MKGENALSTLGYIILGIVIAYTINLSLSFALGTDMPVVAVESNSMVPAFARGDILLLSGVPASNLKVGDIIVYSPEGQAVPIVHRIITKNPDGSFQTKGDANAGQLTFEKHIAGEQIHGMVVGILPYVGWIKIGVTSYLIPNIVFIIAGIAVIALISLAPRYIKKMDKKDG